MKKLFAVLGRAHQPDASLSSFADGSLGAREAARVAAHIAACARCRARVDGLRALRAMLAALPEEDAPRSFRLRPADVAAARARPAPSFALRAMPALAAAAAVVFVALFALDTRGGGGAQPAPALQLAAKDAASPPAAAFAPREAGPESSTPRAIGGARSVPAPVATPQAAAAAPPQPSAGTSAGDAASTPATGPPRAADSVSRPAARGGTDWLRWAAVAAALVALSAGAASIATRATRRR